MIGVEFRGEIGYSYIEDIGHGEGRNSTVWKVFDKRLNGEFAAKEIAKKDFLRDPSEYFVEAQTMFAADHPNVVPIRCCCETADTISLIMPFYQNGSLSRRIASAPLSLHEIIAVGRQILFGVAKIHLARKLHLDVKPSNVLFDNAGVALVADFGQSCGIGSDGIATPPPMYHYAMPPEVLQYFAVVVESDIFQVGLTLYRAVNGEKMFAAQKPKRNELESAIVSGEFPDRDAFMPHVPKRLRTIIRKALNVEPEERYRTAQQFANELGKVRVPLNWVVAEGPSGKVEWRATRRGRPDFVISRHQNGGNWCVELWHEKNGNKRRACTNAWSKFSSQAKADKYLKSLFEMQA